MLGELSFFLCKTAMSSCWICLAVRRNWLWPGSGNVLQGWASGRHCSVEFLASPGTLLVLMSCLLGWKASLKLLRFPGTYVKSKVTRILQGTVEWGIQTVALFWRQKQLLEMSFQENENCSNVDLCFLGAPCLPEVWSPCSAQWHLWSLGC